MSEHYDVIVIGAGLVGATLAAKLALGDAGRQWRIAVIEAGGPPKRFENHQFDPRVAALTLPDEEPIGERQALEEILAPGGSSLERATAPFRALPSIDGELRMHSSRCFAALRG